LITILDQRDNDVKKNREKHFISVGYEKADVGLNAHRKIEKPSDILKETKVWMCAVWEKNMRIDRKPQVQVEQAG
jgi:hypothetical protein